MKVRIPKSGPNFDREYELLQKSVQNEIKMLQEIKSKLPLQIEHIIQILGCCDGDSPPSFHAEFGAKRALEIVTYINLTVFKISQSSEERL